MISYNRSVRHARPQRGRDSCSARVPDDPLPRAQRLRRQPTWPASTPNRFGSLLKNHKVYVSVGHDGVLVGQQRANVEAAAMPRQHDVPVRQRGLLDTGSSRASTAATPHTGRSSATSRPGTTPRSTRPANRRRPGETRGFANPPGGANPENGLTGTMYKSNFTTLRFR